MPSSTPTPNRQPEYKRMVEEIGKRLGLTSVKFNKIETLIKAIGLPKERICTHCFDRSSYFYQDIQDEKQ